MIDSHSRLMAVKCKVCGTLYFPPKYLCPVGGANQFESVQLSGKGEILTHTTIRMPPTGFEDQAPYDIAVIRLSEGINLTARMIVQDVGQLKIGDKISFVKKEAGANWFKVEG